MRAESSQADTSVEIPIGAAQKVGDDPSVDFETLIQATLRLNSTEDLETMCANILSGACQVLRSEAASLMLIDAPSGNLKWFSVLGEAGDILVHHDLAPGEGIAGWVARGGESVVSNDVAQDARFCNRIDALSGFVTRSLLCVPLVAHGTIYGVLEFINHPAGHPYSDYDAHKARAFASLSAVALENSRLIRLAEEVGNAREIARFKNEMASVVADEIRNPLTAIRGFAEIVADEEAELPRRQDFSARILEESQRVERMLENFLQLAQLENDQIELREDRVSLGDVLRRAHASHGERAPRHTVRLSLPEDGEIDVIGDRFRVEQVVDHLLSNAIGYSPEGCLVTLRAVQRGAEWQVFVTDRGAGIAADCLPRIFHHFYRIPNVAYAQPPGSGLGLTMVKTLVEKMNGRVGVESAPGQGSTFWFTLPAAP